MTTANRFRFRAWVNQDINESYPEADQVKRGWLKPQCRWFQLSNNGQELMWGWDECEEPMLVGRDVTICFSTGLTDKNGLEIFEGDIVSGCFGIPPIGVRSVVEWHNGVLAIHTDYKPEWADIHTAVECLGIRVIGNIYENPDILVDGPTM